MSLLLTPNRTRGYFALCFFNSWSQRKQEFDGKPGRRIYAVSEISKVTPAEQRVA